MARTLMGTVTSDKADKTIVIKVHTRKTHPIYKKQYSVTTKFIAHDENNEAREGDKVVIVETRPVSKRKHFALQKIVETARIKHVEDEDKVRKTVKRTDEATEESAEDTKPAKVSKKTQEDK